MKNIRLPELGEGIKGATVACWHKAVGDHVAGDEDIVEVVTDKASFNVSAPEAGVIKEICVGEGREASIGEVLAVFEPLDQS